MGVSWLVWAGAATVLWGVGYMFLKPAGAVAPLVTQTLFGAGTFVLNMLAMGVWAAANNQQNDGSARDAFLQPWRDLQTNPNQNGWYLIGYVAANSFAGLLFLVALTYPEAQVSVVTAFTSGYPTVTAILVYVIWKEYKNVDLRLAIPGMIVTVVGLVLLALSPIPPQNPNPASNNQNSQINPISNINDSHRRWARPFSTLPHTSTQPNPASNNQNSQINPISNIKSSQIVII
jgi:hypothetical protein